MGAELEFQKEQPVFVMVDGNKVPAIIITLPHENKVVRGRYGVFLLSQDAGEKYELKYSDFDPENVKENDFTKQELFDVLEGLWNIRKGEIDRGEYILGGGYRKSKLKSKSRKTKSRKTKSRKSKSRKSRKSRKSKAKSKSKSRS